METCDSGSTKGVGTKDGRYHGGASATVSSKLKIVHFIYFTETGEVLRVAGSNEGTNFVEKKPSHPTPPSTQSALNHKSVEDQSLFRNSRL
jgi:hypothetical protein